jgi:hypothetical protein
MSWLERLFIRVEAAPYVRAVTTSGTMLTGYLICRRRGALHLVHASVAFHGQERVTSLMGEVVLPRTNLAFYTVLIPPG